MILIPQRLFDNKNVRTILRDGNVCILNKELTEPVVNREGYISNHVISIQLSGEQHIRNYEEQLIKVKEGKAIFIPRGMYHISDLIPKSGTFHNLLFYLDDSLIQEFLSNSRVTEVSRESVPTHMKFEAGPAIQHFVEGIFNIYQANQLRNKNFLNLKILELLYLLNSLAGDQRFANFLFRLTLPQKRNIRTFMDQNFDKPLKIEDYAYLTGRSLSTFRRDFKAYYDITPQQWLKEKRMEKAMAVLKKKEVSVTDLAFEVGYENISYFIKAFSRQYGQTPKQYMLALHRNKMNN